MRVAAIGDLHVQESDTAPYRELFAEISNHADVLLLCGDLTNFGKTTRPRSWPKTSVLLDPGPRRARQPRLRMWRA